LRNKNSNLIFAVFSAIFLTVFAKRYWLMETGISEFLVEASNNNSLLELSREHNLWAVILAGICIR